MWLKVGINENEESVVEIKNEYEVYKMQFLFHPLSMVWKIMKTFCK